MPVTIKYVGTRPHLFAQAASIVPPEWHTQEAFRTWLERRFSSRIPEDPLPYCLIAIDETERILGLVTINAPGVAAIPPGYAGIESFPSIGNLVVSPDFRGRQIGRNLIAAACGYVRKLGYEKAFLWQEGDTGKTSLLRHFEPHPPLPQTRPAPPVRLYVISLEHPGQPLR